MNKSQKIPLLCVVVLTITISLFMVVTDVITYIDYLDAKVAINAYEEDIRKNLSKKPSYAKLNENNIRKDIEEMKQVVHVFKYQFGKPHRKALQKFVDSLNFKKNVKIQQNGKESTAEAPWTETDIYAAFAAHYKALPEEEKGTLSDNKNDEKIWKSFLEKLYAVNGNTVDPSEFGQATKRDTDKTVDPVKLNAKKKQIDEAYKEFVKYAAAYAEFQTSDVAYKCMLDALGLPHTSNYGDLSELLAKQKYWIEVIPGLKDYSDVKNADMEKIIRQLLMSINVNPVDLRDEQYALVYRQIQIKQDLFKRMRDAKIVRVDGIELVTDTPQMEMFRPGTKAVVNDPLTGKENRGFVTYSYEIKVVGSMEGIRKFLNSLNSAYSDYRVYNVRDIVLSREVESEQMSNILKEESSSLKEGQEVPDSYGMRVIGRDLNVTCKILVDYIMYVQDLLPRNAVK